MVEKKNKKAVSEENSVQVMSIYVKGKTEKEAEKELSNVVKEYKTKHNLELDKLVEKTYDVLIFKGATLGKSNLQGQGNSYKEAIDACVKDFGIDLSNFNQEVRIIADYELSPKDIQARKEIKPPSAGPSYSSKTLKEFVI